MPIAPKPPKPPKSLSKESTAFFVKFCDEWETDDSIIAVLTKVCQSLDTAAAAAEEIRKNGGLTCLDRFGCVKIHPCVLAERAASAAAINGLKALGALKNAPEIKDRYASKVF
jgi:phage terminase small subunit